MFSKFTKKSITMQDNSNKSFLTYQ